MPKSRVVPLSEASDAAAMERRRSDRADLVVRVTYQTVDELFTDFARNINEGGMFVETERPPPVGAEVSLEFNLPGSDEPVAVAGREIGRAHV